MLYRGNNWNRYHNTTGPFGIILNYSENKDKIINLQSHKILINALQLIPKNFIITTENGSSKFNIDILKLSSPVILQYHQSYPNKSEYHLNCVDDKNVLSKLEQLYQGKPVIIEKDEILIFEQIIKMLQIQSRSKYYSQLNRCTSDESTKAIIDYGSLINNLKSKESFTIKTNKKEYKCNPIGINLSSTIKEFLASNPNSDTYSYNFPDEFNEFQLICDFFNFKVVSITTNNMDSVRKIAEELKISFILNEAGNFADIYDNFYELVDDQQESIDEINELFDLLSNIKEKTVKYVKESIFQSKWSEKEEEVQELGAFFLQVIDSNLTLHQYLLDLLIQLDSESTEKSKLKILLPLIVEELKFSFGTNIQNCSFVYLLYKKEIISKQDLFKLLDKKLINSSIEVDALSYKDYDNDDDNESDNPNINQGPLFNYTYRRNKDKSEVKKVYMLKVNTPVLLWFLPEIIEVRRLKKSNKLRGYGLVVDSFIKTQFNQIDQYKKMRDNGEPVDEITLALRHDDIDKFQSIISVGHFNVENGIIPYNIYEEFVPNGKTKYLNYAAAYGAVKCFKYLLLNHSKVDEKTFKLAIYGGNIEIIKIVEQKCQDDDIFNQLIDKKRRDRPKKKTYLYMHKDNCLFTRRGYLFSHNNDVSNFINEAVNDVGFTYSIVPSIIRHQNGLFDWILEKNLELKSIDEDSFKDLIVISYESGNAHSLIELLDKYFEFLKKIITNNEEEKSLFEDMIKTTCRNGFYLLTKILLKSLECVISKDQQDSLLISPVFNFRKSWHYQRTLFYDPLYIHGNKDKYREICTMSSGNLSILKLFITKYDQQELEKILIYAIDTNNVNIVTYIFDNFVKKDALKITEDNSELFISYSLLQKSDYLFNYLMEQIKQISPSLNIKWSINMVKNASYSNNVQLAKFITEFVLKENPKEDFILPFIDAVSSNSVELCNFFIEKKVFLSFKKIKKYSMSISKANKGTFSIFMNVVPQEKMKKIYNYLYIDSIESNNIDIIEIILKTMPNGPFDLYKVVKNSNLEIVKLILKNNNSPKFVNKRKPQGSALSVAVRNGDFEIVKELLSVPGIDVNLYDKSGKTPLIEAFNNHDLNILNLILDFYGDDIINSQSWQLDILIQEVIKNTNNTLYNDVINRVLEIKGIELHLVNESKNRPNVTLFERAYKNNDINFIAKLLSLDKFDVNRYEPLTGDTVLIDSIKNKKIEIANLLIKYPKTNINFRNNDNQTPLTIAVQKHLDSIVHLLLNDEKFDKEDSLFNYALSISSDETTKILFNSKYLDINDTMYTNQNQPFTIKKKDSWGDSLGYKLNVDTLLVDAARNQNESLIDLIINHKDFDKKKSKLNMAIFASLEKAQKATIFKKLIKIIDCDSFNKYQDNKSRLLNEITKTRFSDQKTDLKLSELLNEALESSNLTFTEKDLNDVFENVFRELKSSSQKKLFTINDLENIIKYDKNHNNYIDLNKMIYGNRTYFTSLDKEIDQQLFLDLLEFGADPNIPDGYGIYPLQYAFYIGNNDLIRMLIKSNKIDYNKRIPDVHINIGKVIHGYYGSNLYKHYSQNEIASQKIIKNHVTYLHIAARYYDPTILKIFLDNKLIDINVTDDLGNTPLIDACRFNVGNNVDLIFQVDNLDFLHCNKEGKDALHVLNIELLNDDKPINDKNEYLKKLMVFLDKDQNHAKTNSHPLSWRENKYGSRLNHDNKGNTSNLSNSSTFGTNNSKTNISIASKWGIPKVVQYPNSSNQSNASKSSHSMIASNSSNQSNASKSSHSMIVTNPFNQSNASKSLNSMITSNSSNQSNTSKSSHSMITSNPSNQSNTSKSLNSMITSNSSDQSIQSNHTMLIEDVNPEEKEFSYSYNQTEEASKQTNNINNEAVDNSFSDEGEINSLSHSKRMKRRPIYDDYESQNQLGYPDAIVYPQIDQFYYQSLIAQQQLNQMLLINHIDQIRFNQQMMMQANLNISLKRNKSKRKKKSKHD